MQKGTGTALIGLGIVLVVVGSILDFAVTVTTSGFNINTVGLILLMGMISCLIGIAMFAMAWRDRRPYNVRVLPDGGLERGSSSNATTSYLNPGTLSYKYGKTRQANTQGCPVEALV